MIRIEEETLKLKVRKVETPTNEDKYPFMWEVMPGLTNGSILNKQRYKDHAFFRRRFETPMSYFSIIWKIVFVDVVTLDIIF